MLSYAEHVRDDISKQCDKAHASVIKLFTLAVPHPILAVHMYLLGGQALLAERSLAQHAHLLLLIADLQWPAFQRQFAGQQSCFQSRQCYFAEGDLPVMQPR